jgi:hypothetical protein
LDIAQANPSDFKLFNQEFTKAKDSYFESLSKIGIIEERINRAKLFPDPDPAKQKKILADLKDELSKAEKFKSTASGNLSDVKDVPSAFYRYGEGGIVTVDEVQSVLEPLSKKVFDLGYIKLNEKKLGNDFSTIFLKDLSISVVERDTWVAKYMFSIKDIPTTKIEFLTYTVNDKIIVSFSIATRNLQNKSGRDIMFMLQNLGFPLKDPDMDIRIDSSGKSKSFNIYFGKKYYNLFKSGSAVSDVIEYFKVVALMLILPFTSESLEKRDGQTIKNMREVFANGEIEENKGSSSSGSSGDDSDKIKEFLATYDENKNPSAFRPKKGESEVRGILNRIVENKLISKQEWDDCVQRAINTKELYDKLIQYHIGTQSGGKTSVLFNILNNRVVELATANTEKALSLMYAYEKLITPKFTKEEMIDFPVLMMMIWEHKPPLDSSIFE